MAKNKGLGKGLGAIFDDNYIDDERAEGVTNIRISSVEPKKDQPRKNFDNEALASLADSIAQNGVLQPILVKEGMGGTYTIIAGERRWRASKLAGLIEIPAIVMNADEFTAAKIAMVENLQREDLNPCEEALGYAELMRNYSLTQEEIASHIGKSRSAVANSLRLLDLPEKVLDMLADGTLSAGHGRALLGLKNREAILPLAEKTAARALSVRELESAVKTANRAKTREGEEETPVSAKVNYIADLEDKVTAALGRRCKITATAKKRTVALEFTDNEDLEALLTSLCGHAPIED